jgi:hypothetical protein
MFQAPCIPNVFRESAKARTNKDFFELIRVLTRGTGYEVFAQENSFTEQGPYEVIAWLVQQYGVECRCTIDERRRSIIETSIAKLAFLPNMASLIRTRLRGRKLEDMLGPETLQGRFLLHCAAQNLIEHWTNRNDDRRNIDERKELFSLIHQLVRGQFDLHRLNFFGRSPLHALFWWFIRWLDPKCLGYGLCRVFSAHRNDDHLNSLAADFCVPARIWLEQLSSAGVDLWQYGQREQFLNFKRSEEVNNECFYTWRKKRAGETTEHTLKLRLTTFIYGSSLCDWQFWITEVFDESFAEFWDMVDHPERSMPGAWNG